MDVYMKEVSDRGTVTKIIGYAGYDFPPYSGLYLNLKLISEVVGVYNIIFVRVLN